MIFRRRKKNDEATEAEADQVDDGSATPDSADVDAADDEASGDGGSELDLAALDALDWRAAGPYDVNEIDLDDEPLDGSPRIDLGSMIVTGFTGAELRLQVAEGTQQILSAMLVKGTSALELGVYAAPRSGGLWAELRTEFIETTTEAGGSASLSEGPFGVELGRTVPVTTPDGEPAYQPSRMWMVEGPRWLLRGIVYGEAALPDPPDSAVAELVTAFRQVVVRRGDQAVAPGDLLPLAIPEGLQPAEDA
jgi:Protein of unknown function (DUF3710)